MDKIGKKNVLKVIKNRKFIDIVCIAVAIVCLAYAVKMNADNNKIMERYTSIASQLSTERDTVSELRNQIAQLEAEKNELVNGAQNQLSDIKNAYEKGEWQNVIDLTAALHEQYNGSEEDKEAQELAKTSQEKLDEEAAAKAAEEAKGYETGITYDQLARTPDDYMGKKVKFSGKVIQVIEGDDSVQIRLAVDNNYDTILLGEYTTSTVSSRVLDDDQITIYGTSVGTISYQSTMGGKITIPGVYIEKIDQ